jgi:hypothetical protein
MRGFDKHDEVTKTFTVTASSEFMERLERHLAFIVRLGAVGHSCVAGVSVDGDGSDRMKVAEELPNIKEADIKVRGKYPDQYEVAS